MTEHPPNPTCDCPDCWLYFTDDLPPQKECHADPKHVIDELVRQSGMDRILNEHAHEYGNWPYTLDGYPELAKLIELVVQKCASITNWDKCEMSKEQRIRLSIYQDIKELFGSKCAASLRRKPLSDDEIDKLP